MATTITATTTATVESIALRGKSAEALKALIAARALKAEAEKAESAARATLLAVLKEKGVEKGYVAGHSVTLRVETRNGIDLAALRETMPEVAQAFATVTTVEKLVTR